MMSKFKASIPPLFFFLVFTAVVLSTVFTDTYDTNTPLGSDNPAEADDRMREIKAAVQERENVDHYWPLTGTEVSDVDTGEHRKSTYRVTTDPTAVADKGFVYVKDANSIAELHYLDENDNKVQITSEGVIPSSSTDMLDQDAMDDNDATKTASQQSVKAYQDNIVGNEADGQTTPTTTGYQVYDVDGTPTKVYTKYITGTLDNDTETTKAHGLDWDDILHVSAVVSGGTVWIVNDYDRGSGGSAGFALQFDATNIIFTTVEASTQGKAYRLKIEYTE